MKPVFKNEAATAKMLEWYDRFRARLTVPTESRTVNTRFGDTHVLVGGPEKAPPLVVCHGAMASSAHVMVELAPLYARYRVYAVDVIGQSVKTPLERPSVKNNDYGIWLADVLDGLGLERTCLIAISWGGFSAIRLAVHAPDRIQRLALLVPAGIVNGYAWQGLTKLMLPMTLWKMFPSRARFEKFARNLLTTTDDDWMPYMHDAFQSFNMDMRVPMLAKPEELAAFKAPVLVVSGDADITFPGHKLADRARELFVNMVPPVVLENCKHSPPTTDAFRRELTDRLAAFFDGTPAVAAAS